jgi:hypothetical protein
MKTFKKLFLSATTILMTMGAVDPAQAFIFLKARNELYNAPLQQDLQQVSNPQPIIPEITAKSQELQMYHPVLTALLTASYQQSLAQFRDPESQDAFSLLIRHLAPVFTVQNQGHNTPEERRKSRTQLIELAQKFKAIHEASQNVAPLQEKVDDKHQGLIEEIRVLKEGIRQLQEAMIAKPQELQVRVDPEAVMIAPAEDHVILSRVEFARLTDRIGALTEQIDQLKGNHHDLIGSVSALQASYEEGQRNYSSGIPSSAFRPLNASIEEETQSSTTEGGETLTKEPSPTSNTDTPTREEDTAQTSLKSSVPTLPTDRETPISSSGLPEIAGASQPVLMPKEWGKKEFEQAVLGMRPATLSSMDEAEANLWRTFTVLRFSGVKEDKPWTSWGGAFTTEELEDKFKDNAFMRNAFQVKKSLSIGDINDFTYLTFPDILGYFTSKTPSIKLDSDKDADLIKAYYFRGLYRALTGDDWKGRSNDSMAAKFVVDPATGIKGGRFNYGSDTLDMPSYESSIYDAERYFQSTPWHSLFIDKVRQATNNTLDTQKKIDEIKKSNNSLILSMLNATSDTEELESQHINEIVFKIISENEKEIKAIGSRSKLVLKAPSLKNIDEALGIL